MTKRLAIELLWKKPFENVAPPRCKAEPKRNSIVARASFIAAPSEIEQHVVEGDCRVANCSLARR